MEDLPKFKVRDAFPADEQHALLISLLVAVRHLNVLSFAGGPTEDPIAGREFIIHTFLASITTISEIYGLFTEADAKGLFDFIEQGNETETQNALERVRDRCADPGVTAAYAKIRNNAGAHWSSKVTRRVLREIADKEYRVADGTTFVISQEVAIRIARSMGYSDENDYDRTFWTSALLSDLNRVVNVAYLREAFGVERAATTEDSERN